MVFICAAVGKTESQEIERVMHGMHGPKKQTENRTKTRKKQKCPKIGARVVGAL